MKKPKCPPLRYPFPYYLTAVQSGSNIDFRKLIVIASLNSTLLLRVPRKIEKPIFVELTAQQFGRHESESFRPIIEPTKLTVMPYFIRETRFQHYSHERLRRIECLVYASISATRYPGTGQSTNLKLIGFPGKFQINLEFDPVHQVGIIGSVAQYEWDEDHEEWQAYLRKCDICCIPGSDITEAQLSASIPQLSPDLVASMPLMGYPTALTPDSRVEYRAHPSNLLIDP